MFDLDDVADEPARSARCGRAGGGAASGCRGRRRGLQVRAGRSRSSDAPGTSGHRLWRVSILRTPAPRPIRPAFRPLHDAAAAGAARAGGAFIGQPQPLAEAGRRWRLGRLALEAELAGIGLDGDLHVRRYRCLVCKSVGRISGRTAAILPRAAGGLARSPRLPKYCTPARPTKRFADDIRKSVCLDEGPQLAGFAASPRHAYAAHHPSLLHRARHRARPPGAAGSHARHRQGALARAVQRP